MNILQTIIEIVAVILFIALGIVIGIKTSRNSNKKALKENEEIAENLDLKLSYSQWNERPYKNDYLFFDHQGLSGQFSYSFSGLYKNFTVTLFPCRVMGGRNEPDRNYLVTEILNTKHQYTDMVIVSKEEGDLYYKLLLHTYNKVSLEGDEFKKLFSVYSMQIDTAFYSLAPDAMAKLIDIKGKTFNELFIQIKQNSTLIAGDYQPYVDYVNSLKTAPDKKTVLINFLDFSLEINNLLK